MNEGMNVQVAHVTSQAEFFTYINQLVSVMVSVLVVWIILFVI